MKKLHTPALSTGFSENGNKAKSRFENILSKSKKRAIFLVVSLLAAIIAAELLIACTGESTERIADKLDNRNIIIGGTDRPTDMWITPTVVIPTAAISTHAPLYYDKAMLYQNRDYITNPELTTIANVYPVEENLFFVSLPAFNGGLYGYTTGDNLKFVYGDEDYNMAQITEDIPEKGINRGDTVRIDERNENIFTVTHLLSGQSFETDKIYIGTVEDENEMYPKLYSYLESEIKKYGNESFDNIMITKIGFFPGRCTYDEETKIYDYTIYVHVTYTKKHTDEENLSYIRDAIASRDSNRLTYRDDAELFIHGMIPQMKIRFELDKYRNIENASVELSYNAGQIVTNMPIENPREEWVNIESIGEIFPEKLSKVTYAKDNVEIEQ